MKKEIDLARRQINQFLDRIVATTSESVIAAYENRIKELEAKKAV